MGHVERICHWLVPVVVHVLGKVRWMVCMRVVALMSSGEIPASHVPISAAATGGVGHLMGSSRMAVGSSIDGGGRR